MWNPSKLAASQTPDSVGSLHASLASNMAATQVQSKPKTMTGEALFSFFSSFAQVRTYPATGLGQFCWVQLPSCSQSSVKGCPFAPARCLDMIASRSGGRREEVGRKGASRDGRSSHNGGLIFRQISFPCLVRMAPCAGFLAFLNRSRQKYEEAGLGRSLYRCCFDLAHNLALQGSACPEGP